MRPIQLFLRSKRHRSNIIRVFAPLLRAIFKSIDSMVMLRRMALLAWIGSHAETKLAQLHMPGFADGTATLAERYLRGAIWL